jgi:hypothetical protein
MSSAGYTHGQSAYAVGPSDPRFVADRYAAPELDPSLVAEARALEKRRAGKGDGSNEATAPALAAARAPVAAPREPPVVAARATRMSELQQPSSPPVTAASGATARRSLWDKQPWEIELDKIVRSICRGC